MNFMLNDDRSWNQMPKTTVNNYKLVYAWLNDNKRLNKLFNMDPVLVANKEAPYLFKYKLDCGYPDWRHLAFHYQISNIKIEGLLFI